MINCLPALLSLSSCAPTQWYKRALRTHPRAPPSVRLGIGACHLKLANFPAARAAFTRALDLDPDSTEAGRLLRTSPRPTLNLLLLLLLRPYEHLHSW